MTKRHFIAIAAILKAQWDAASDSLAAQHSVRNITFAQADLFDADNPNFNRPVFYQAVFGDAGPFA